VSERSGDLLAGECLGDGRPHHYRVVAGSLAGDSGVAADVAAADGAAGCSRTRQLQKAAGLRQGQQQLREQQQRQPQRMWSSLCRIAIGALQGSGCRSVQAVALLRSPFAALSEVLVVAPFRSRVQQVDSASAGYGAARVALQGQRVRQRVPQVLRCSGCDRRRTGGGRRSCSSREAAAEQLAWKVSWCSRGWCSCCGLWNS
jgi:hypothetical protein